MKEEPSPLSEPTSMRPKLNNAWLVLTVSAMKRDLFPSMLDRRRPTPSPSWAGNELRIDAYENQRRTGSSSSIDWSSQSGSVRQLAQRFEQKPHGHYVPPWMNVKPTSNLVQKSAAPKLAAVLVCLRVRFSLCLA